MGTIKLHTIIGRHFSCCIISRQVFVENDDSMFGTFSLSSHKNNMFGFGMAIFMHTKQKQNKSNPHGIVGHYFD